MSGALPRTAGVSFAQAVDMSAPLPARHVPPQLDREGSVAGKPVSCQSASGGLTGACLGVQAKETPAPSGWLAGRAVRGRGGGRECFGVA